MCPQLFGLFTVKLAALLMLIGGVPRDKEGDVRVRGEVHMLLVGDPGTGKSQFQRHVAKLSSRAVMASGNASTAAGLTAAAVKDGAHWTLEAGALVLADGGVCCIDEFDGIREADRRVAWLGWGLGVAGVELPALGGRPTVGAWGVTGPRPSAQDLSCWP